MLTSGLWSGALLLVFLVLSLAQITGRPTGSVFRRTWSGSFADGLAKGGERAIQEAQAIEQPEKTHSLSEHRAMRISEDPSGGPDDPGRA